MINIISNNCIGSRLYQLNNIQFNTPFVWSLIDINDFVNLIKNYKNIEFSNIKISLEPNNHCKNQSIIINIDNLVNIHYIHYIYDETCDIPIKKEGAQDKDIFYKDIINYSKQKYYDRLLRFNKNISYEILYSFNYSYLKLSKDQYYNNFIKLVDLSKLGHKILIIMNNSCEFKETASKYESDYLHILWLTNWECTVSHPAHYQKIQNEYNIFFNKNL